MTKTAPLNLRVIYNTIMENNNNIHENLYDVEDLEKSRQLVVSYIKNQKKYFTVLNDDTYVAAYRLAGLMATDYIRGLAEDDPIVPLLVIAGELEIKPDDSNKLMTELYNGIETL